MTVQGALERAGLTPNEIKVYLALIYLGSALAGDIAKKADLHRRPTYDTLTRLVEKGLVSYTVKEGKKSFHPATPDKLLEMIYEKEKELKEILPELKEKFKATKVSIFTQVYEGREGAKTVMQDILREGKEWWSVSTGKGGKVLPIYLEQFNKERVRLGIKRKVLLANNEEGRGYYKDLKKQGLLKLKFLPKENKNPQAIWIYGNKVVNVFVSGEYYPALFLIENKEIADSHRYYFNMMWEQGLEESDVINK